MRIRVTTRAELFEKRNQEYVERGCRVEDERPTPVNGLCSFIAIRELPVQDRLSELVPGGPQRKLRRLRRLMRRSDVAQNPLSLRWRVHPPSPSQPETRWTASGWDVRTVVTTYTSSISSCENRSRS